MLRDAEFKVVYASGENEPVEFYITSLLEAKSFDLGLGYFSSSGFRALAYGFAYFISRGGKMRIIINNVLSSEDKSAITRGQQTSTPNELVEQNIINDITKLTETLSRKDRHFFNCLSWLIAAKNLEIIAIIPEGSTIGIAHQKFGIFKDELDDKVAFTGSPNFSLNSLFYNIETISCYKSWTGEDNETERINYYYKLFQKIWKGQNKSVRIIPINNVKIAIQENFPMENIEFLLQEELSLINETLENERLPNNLKVMLEQFKQKLPINTKTEQKPNCPKQIEFRDYQKIALENWIRNNYKGLFEMATGTGKTITALNCALFMFNKIGYIHLLILVPTLTLAVQWQEELEEFNFQNIIQANSNNNNWYNDILKIIHVSKTKTVSFCLITTYNTFLISSFQSIITKLDKNTLIIADEVHNFGTQNLIKLFPENINNRLGLSATPTRYFDETGTDEILKYFEIIKEPTFKLGMKEAIEREILCEYYYYPYIVPLTKDEMEKYREISRQLMKYFDKKTGLFRDSTIVSSLLLKRKRIIHKATNKLEVLREIFLKLTEENPNLKYTLLYVPEGKPQEFEMNDQRLINEYAGVVSNEFNLKQHQYIGITDNKQEVLKQFSDGEIAVLTAMKCLDEGVDIKRTEIAIFGASTSNPRQFIQRRGRILRKHPEKKYARIYDMIVVPSLNILDDENVFEIDKSLLRKELVRVHEFADMAINKYSALEALKSITEKFNINIYSF